MYILGIESSTKKLSIAISRQDMLLHQSVLKTEAGSMTGIIPLVDNSLRKVRFDLSAIDVFSVNTGPGDFTGTRIGISISRAFATALDKPVFGIPGLDIFAAGLFKNNIYRINMLLKKGFAVLLVPVLDVRKGELFLGIYGVNSIETENAVAKIYFYGKHWYVDRVTSDHLVERSEISASFKSLIKNEDGSGILPHRDHMIFLGGTAFGTGSGLLSDMKKLDYDFILSKKSLFPEARFLNLCTYYRALAQAGKSIDFYYGTEGSREDIKGDTAVVPVYVRDFIPSSKKYMK